MSEKINEYLQKHRNFHTEEKNAQEGQEEKIYDLNNIEMLIKNGYIISDLKFSKEAIKFKYYNSVELRCDTKINRNCKIKTKELVCLVELPENSENIDFTKNKLVLDFKEQEIKIGEKKRFETNDPSSFQRLKFIHGTLLSRNNNYCEILLRSEHFSRKKAKSEFDDLEMEGNEKQNKTQQKYQKKENISDSENDDLQKLIFNLNFKKKDRDTVYLILKSPFDFLNKEYKAIMDFLETYYNKVEKPIIKSRNLELVSNLIIKEKLLENQKNPKDNDYIQPSFIDDSLNDEQKEIVMKGLNVI